MVRSHPTPLGALARGAAAGVAGTAAMTAAQTAYLRATGGEESTTPGQVAERILEGVLQLDVPDERLPALSTGMHWLYGTSWGTVHGLVAGTVRPRSALRAGAAFGLSVWAASLVELPAMKLAPPVWEYPPASLVSEVGFHLVYGVAVASAYRALT